MEALVDYTSSQTPSSPIPLPEHPRPDKMRTDWMNLNGTWKFRFDGSDAGIGEGWQNGSDESFDREILVPFPWGSALSGVKDEAPIAWYRRGLSIPSSWKGKRVFLVIGASDWQTDVWLGQFKLGVHRGGYTPFEFDLTPFIDWSKETQLLTLRVDDKRRDFVLFGKQGYGDVHGLWQTVYLEARSETYLDTVHFLPDIDRSLVTVKATLSAPACSEMSFAVHFKAEDRSEPAVATIVPNQMEVSFEIPLQDVKLWDLDHPYLYEVRCELSGAGACDCLETYFGMRKIGVAKLPGSGYPYVALNNKPVYLQLTLDQSYHPGGYYTFPTDEFMKNEILLSKRLGLNGNRIHIKVEVPRKLYWADKLGLLIMADLPNSWGAPTQEMFQESEYCLRQMVARDMNHPAVFSWILYNETWGLFTDCPDGNGGEKKRRYLPVTQQKVAEMYRLAKSLDPTRLVEDQSPCNYDHVVTDLFSWHAYRTGHSWASMVQLADTNTFPGSTWNCVNGHVQGEAPMFNSECGNVWGYEGSTGDVDWSWDYHLMLDAFRRHPKVAGWLYTEHHDVINEWNGYVRFDRTPKYLGIEELFPGMTIRDWHSDAYLSLDPELCRCFKPGETWNLPVALSLTTDRFAGKCLKLSAIMRSWDDQGNVSESALPQAEREIVATSWQHEELAPVLVQVPKAVSAGVVCFTLRDGESVIARNFTCFHVRDGEAPRCETLSDGTTVLRIAPSSFSKAEWSQKQWNVYDGLKVNGAGKGYFEYEVTLPAGKTFTSAEFIAEIGSKKLFGKDMDGVDVATADLGYMLGGGHHDPGKNPNAYPMTDTECWPGAVRVMVNGQAAKVVPLADDSADHRGILSWAAQPRDVRKLSEAGSFGYLVRVALPMDAVASQDGKVTLRLEADDNGLALYGERFGRYPMDMTLVLK